MYRFKSALVILLTSFSSSAEIAITLLGGESYSNTLNTAQSRRVKLNDENHYALTLEKVNRFSRYGLYYGTVSPRIDTTTNHEVEFSYWLFQSALIMPVNSDLSGYLGAHLGVTQVNPDWLPGDHYFAAGLFGGLEYGASENIKLLLEGRWLSSVIENDSQISCNIGTDTKDQCLWHFDGDVLSQFQASVGISYRF